MKIKKEYDSGQIELLQLNYRNYHTIDTLCIDALIFLIKNNHGNEQELRNRYDPDGSLLKLGNYLMLKELEGESCSAVEGIKYLAQFFKPHQMQYSILHYYVKIILNDDFNDDEMINRFITLLLDNSSYNEEDDVFELRSKLKTHPKYKSAIDQILIAIESD